MANHMSTTNEELKKNLQILTIEVISIYNKVFSKIEQSQYTDIDKSIYLCQFDEQIKKLDKFRGCLRLMIDDHDIKKLQGKLVGTVMHASLVEDEDSCLLSFLKQSFLKNYTYNEEEFDLNYSSFEEFFYSDRLCFKDSSPLYNFEYLGKEIDLGHNIKIIRSAEETTPHKEYMKNIYNPRDRYSKSNFNIERPDSEIALGKLQEIEIETFFDYVVSSIHILKHSAVYRDEVIKTKNLTFHPTSWISSRWPHHKTIATGEKCIIDEDEIGKLKSIVDFIIKEIDRRFITAQRRLSMGTERKDREDRLIDYMIGLEALYLPDGGQELSFKLALRAALLLESESEKRKNNFNFIRNMYKTRSKIVHGRNYDLSPDDISKVEELLRLSIKLWIEEKDKFLANSFTNSGKLKYEGNLDNIFFG